MVGAPSQHAAGEYGADIASDQLPPPPPGALRRTGRRVLRRAVDAGLVGTRLRAHVVVAGFPRAGSTLLQLMIDSCVDDVLSFRTEVEALWAAREAPRRQPWMVTKLPSDVDHVVELRTHYTQHPGRLNLVLTDRDPRAVLVSRHAGYPPERGYYVSTERWRHVHRLVTALRHDNDVTVVDYRDLVSDPQQVQQRLAETVGWHVHTPFADYHRVLPAQSIDRMTTGALGGLRAPDTRSLTAWQAPEHRPRLRRVLEELPALPALLVAAGWDTDERWTDAL